MARNPDYEDKYKTLVLPYLQRQLEQRARLNSPENYERDSAAIGMNKQRADDMALLKHGMQAAANAGGSLNAKEVKTAMPGYVDDINKNFEGAFNAKQSLRKDANDTFGKDVDMAKAGVDYFHKSEDRKLERDKLNEPDYKEGSAVGARGEAQVFDAKTGTYRPAGDGLKMPSKAMPPGGNQIIPGYGGEGSLLERDPQGNYIARPLPPGIKSTKPAPRPAPLSPEGRQQLELDTFTKKEKLKKNLKAKEEYMYFSPMHPGLIKELDALEAQIDKTGTSDIDERIMSGNKEQPGSTIDQKVGLIATKYAKFMDPKTAAMQGEVNSARENLLNIRKYEGMSTSNAQAKKLIQDLRQSVNDQQAERDRAYQDAMREFGGGDSSQPASGSPPTGDRVKVYKDGQKPQTVPRHQLEKVLRMGWKETP